ncbi:uncharacterized protein F4817DRAFT_319359 [Daldinia loculata]|uniref:uncharacterized protein n=1 Tax=Daldinia loculata TaxID=103429 RepID=UPI0020C58F0C|nr:uncharacterized protein F4817DRAFT_319359 [Daldinia loculata]KAI1643826.1 hypothetical protein F4817DRAFT_319359 [Daldinia loculata]
MPPPSQTMQMQLPLRLKPRLGSKPTSHKLPIKSKPKPKPKQLTMCSTVHFAYRCGCTHTTTFECPDTASTFSSLAANPHSRRNRPRRRRRCYGPKSTPTITPLDEDCYDCAQKREKAGGRTTSFGDSDVSSFSLSTDADADTETELDTDTSMAVSTSTSTSTTTSISSTPSTRASSPLDMSILKERDPNLPTKCPLISILDLDLDLRMQLIDLDLLEPLDGF